VVCVSTVVERGRLTVVCSVVVRVTWVTGVVFCVLTLMQLHRKNDPASANKQMIIFFMT